MTHNTTSKDILASGFSLAAFQPSILFSCQYLTIITDSMCPQKLHVFAILSVLRRVWQVQIMVDKTSWIKTLFPQKQQHFQTVVVVFMARVVLNTSPHDRWLKKQCDRWCCRAHFSMMNVSLSGVLTRCSICPTFYMQPRFIGYYWPVITC